MTDPQDPLAQIQHAAAELIPQLTERLARHGLGEIEVRHDQLRVRVAAGAPSGAGAPRAGSAAAAEPGPAAPEPAPPAGPEVVSAAEAGAAVGSPAVGYFVYAEGLGPGLSVEKGDALGYVEMLGVRHEVRAPRRGMVRNLVAETGEAVEYGQIVIELEATEVPG